MQSSARSGVPVVLVTGAPGAGKSTLARVLAGRLCAALIDQDVATGPLVAVAQRLTGLDDLDDPRLAALTRAARYEAVTALAIDNLRAGVPAVLVAPFTAERADLTAWSALSDRLRAAGGRPLLAWLDLDPALRWERLRHRGAARDAAKLAGEPALAVVPPSAPHLRLDAGQPPDELAERVLAALETVAE